MGGTGLVVSPDLTPEEVLAHYGVPGMQWGKRKSDPTSSAPSSSSAAKTLESTPSRKEVKTAERNAKADLMLGRSDILNVRVGEIKAELKTLPKGYESYSQRRTLSKELSQTTIQRDELRNSAAEVRKGGLTSGQKKLLIGGAAAAILVGGVYASTKIESGEFNSMKLRGAALLRGEKFDFKTNPKLAEYSSSNDVLSHVVKGLNPNYASQGGQMNCRRCSFTYELRRRGYDVVSTPTTMGWGHSETGLINALTTGRNVNDPTSIMSNVQSGRGLRAMLANDNRGNPADTFDIPDASKLSEVFKTLAGQPDKARGEILFDFGRFGHSMSYENFNGVPHIFDTQKGVRYDLSKPDEYQSMMDKWGAPKTAAVTRLDNMTLDNIFLSRWSTNRATPTPAPSKPRNSIVSNPGNTNGEFRRRMQKIKG